MGKKKFLIYGLVFILISLAGLFFSPLKARASQPGEVVINEIMWGGSNSDSYDEWLELKNLGSNSINFTATPWSLYKNGNPMILINQGEIEVGGYYLIARKNIGQTILNVTPDLVSSSVSLNNSDVQYKLYDGADNTGILIDIADDGSGSPLAGSNTPTKSSMERNDLPGDGSLKESWHTAVDSTGFIAGATEKGTPGSDNSELANLPPTAPLLLTPGDHAELFKGNEVEFTWSPSTDPENREVTYDFYLSCNENFSDNKLVDSAISKTGYFVETDNIIQDYGICDKYYWKIVASDGVLKTGSTVSTFAISEIVYPDSVLSLINLENVIIRHVQVSSIIDGDTIDVTGLDGFPSRVRLLFVDCPEENQPFYEEAKNFTHSLLGQTIDLVISQDPDEQIDDPRYNRTLAVVILNNRVFNTQLLEGGLASFYDYHNDVLKRGVWLTILQHAQEQRVGLWAAAGNLTLSELLPNPAGDDATGEWIEIYNPCDRSVDLSRFLIDQYLIPSSTMIKPGEFRVFYRTVTGIVLNNTGGDKLNLSFPGGLSFDETSYIDSAKEDESWAFINNIWQWTERLTPGAANLSSVIDDNQKENNLDVPINSEPIEIKTGEFRNFENYLVTISGTVVSTSGNTFFLDDGSGQAKVYIQEATGIAKPPMHRGDLFEVTGIVNLYRGNFRILPQKQDDVRLIQAIKSNSLSSTVIKRASAKAKSTKSPTAAVSARSPTKKVASANDNVQVAGSRSPWWIQMIKAIVGLATVLLVLITIQLRRWRRENPRPSDFGDET